MGDTCQCEVTRAESPSAKSRAQKHLDLEHPECTGTQVGDKWRQVGSNVRSRGQRIQSVAGGDVRAKYPLVENWETRRRQVETGGRQVCNHANQSNQSIQNVLSVMEKLGDKWRQVGDKCEIAGRESEVWWETTGDKCEIMRTRALRASRVYCQTSWRQVGNKCEIMRADNPECSGRQVGDKCEIMRARALRASRVYWETSIQSVFGRKTSPETNTKSCSPSMHPFQRSKNPSQHR